MSVFAERLPSVADALSQVATGWGDPRGLSVTWARDTSSFMRDAVPVLGGYEARKTIQSGTLAYVMDGSRMVRVGPWLSHAVAQQSAGVPLSGADAARAVRLLTHEMTHVTTAADSRRHHHLTEAVAEYVVRADTRRVQEVASALSIEPTDELVHHATGRLRSLLENDAAPTHAYDTMHDQLRDLLQAAKLDPDARSTIDRVSAQSVGDTQDMLVREMLGSNGLEIDRTSYSAMNSTIRDWLARPRSSTHPAKAVEILRERQARWT